MNISARNLKYLIAIYVLVQIILLFFIDVPFSSDSQRYYELAQDCLSREVFYPAPHNLYDTYITAPLYINYTIAILKIYNSPLTIYLSNILLNLLQLFFFYKISKHLFEDIRHQFISVVIYALYLNTLGAVFFNFTEFFFGIFLLAGFYFYLKSGWKNLILSGACIALAANVRPVALALLLAMIITGLIDYFKTKKYEFKKLLPLAGFAATIFLIAFAAKLNYGHYIFWSDTAAVNIIMGANNDATGAYSEKVFEPGNIGYLADEDSLTHFEKSSFWKLQARNWIIKNPGKWISLLPNKLAYLYLWDDWSFYILLNQDRWNFYSVSKLILKEKEPEKFFGEESNVFIGGFFLLYMFHYLFYFVILGLIFYQFYYYRTKDLRIYFSRFREIYFFAFIGTCVTLTSVGMPRYKYHYVLLLALTIVPIIVTYLNRKNSN